MTPFHPRFRKMLLEEPRHRELNLTPQIINEYEALSARLFYLTYYAKDQKRKSRNDPLNAVKRRLEKLKQTYMPNFDQVHKAWVAAQERALSDDGFELNVGWQMSEMWRAIGSWLRHGLWPKVRRRTSSKRKEKSYRRQ